MVRATYRRILYEKTKRRASERIEANIVTFDSRFKVTLKGNEDILKDEITNCTYDNYEFEVFLAYFTLKIFKGNTTNIKSRRHPPLPTPIMIKCKTVIQYKMFPFPLPIYFQSRKEIAFSYETIFEDFDDKQFTLTCVLSKCNYANKSY